MISIFGGGGGPLSSKSNASASFAFFSLWRRAAANGPNYRHPLWFMPAKVCVSHAFIHHFNFWACCYFFLFFSWWTLSSLLSPAYSHVVENTAFFGDVALRFPRIVHHYFDRNADWVGLLRWGLNFCNQTGVFAGGAHQHVLTLVRSPNESIFFFQM